MYRKGNRNAGKQSELEGKSQSWSLRVIASVGLMVHPRRGSGQHLSHSLAQSVLWIFVIPGEI